VIFVDLSVYKVSNRKLFSNSDDTDDDEVAKPNDMNEGSSIGKWSQSEALNVCTAYDPVADQLRSQTHATGQASEAEFDLCSKYYKKLLFLMLLSSSKRLVGFSCTKRRGRRRLWRS
jgi:hypothetical protein